LILQPLVSWLVWSLENAAARGPEKNFMLALYKPNTWVYGGRVTRKLNLSKSVKTHQSYLNEKYNLAVADVAEQVKAGNYQPTTAPVGDEPIRIMLGLIDLASGEYVEWITAFDGLANLTWAQCVANRFEPHLLSSKALMPWACAIRAVVLEAGETFEAPSMIKNREFLARRRSEANNAGLDW